MSTKIGLQELYSKFPSKIDIILQKKIIYGIILQSIITSSGRLTERQAPSRDRRTKIREQSVMYISHAGYQPFVINYLVYR